MRHNGIYTFYRFYSMKMLLAVAVLLCSIQNATAAFIDSGSFLTDTTSELDWLDVTASVNRSYNDVSGQFGIGGDFAGWRYASGIEFNELISHWTGAPELVGFGQVNHTDVGGSIDALVSKLGSTVDTWYMADYGITFDAYSGRTEGNFLDYTYGLIGDPAPDGFRWAAMIEDDDMLSATLDLSQAHYHHTPSEAKGTYMGSFLVRGGGIDSDIPSISSVPEPASVALFGVGLAGLGFSKRKGKSNLKS